MDQEEIISIKQQLHAYCQQAITQRVERIQAAIAEAQLAANEETKSSSGDKYETTRAMMHLEIEKNGIQLQEALKQQQLLFKIRPDQQTELIENGSLAITNQGTFYLAISIGQVTLNNQAYMCISAASPIGQQLVKRGVNYEFVFQGRTYRIEAVF